MTLGNDRIRGSTVADTSIASPRSSGTLSGSLRDARRQIVSLLLERGTLSRTELARLISLNKPTVSSRVAGLIEEGIVREVGAGVSTGGRKPILLEIAADHHLIAGVEVDVGGCRLLLVSLAGEQVKRELVPLDSLEPDAVTAAIADGIDALLIGMPGVTLLGCGVAVPGIVDQPHDSVDVPAPFNWSGIPLRSALEAGLHAPVFITDRGKAAGLGEMWLLGKERAHDLVYLYLGDGVGGAVVLGQKIHQGVGNIAGEIGHMVIDPDGPRCACGRSGCLEALVSTSAITRRARAVGAAGMAQFHGANDRGVVAQIGCLANDGVPEAVEIIETTARWVGIAIANLINVLNPSAIVLGGPTTVWGERLLSAVEREVQQSALPLARASADIVIGEAGERAPVLGASALVMQHAAELLIRSRKPLAVGVQAGGS